MRCLDVQVDSPSPPPELVHYTSGRGLMGILSDRCLWASDVLFMNDAFEFQHAVDLASRLMREDPQLRDILRDDRWGLLDHLDEMGIRPLAGAWDEPICVASLSQSQNDLSQWRGYTKPGDAYAVVFDGPALGGWCTETGWDLQPVQYGDAALPTIADRLRDACEQHMRYSQHDDAMHTPLETWASWLYMAVAPIAPLVKHEDFESEQEWRLIAPVVKGLGSAPRGLKFRQGPSYLVPYKVLDLSPVFKQVWRTLWVGPGPNRDLALKGVVRVLNEHRLLPKERLRVSRTPYRPW